jgi:L-alanine-DL-glutamate epimerase-like enolase superfamily enzyme
MRTFRLRRVEDESGVSGTGIVAEGVEFTHGEIALSWLTQHRSIGFYPNRKELMNIHGHEGKTILVWDNE